MTTLYVTEPYSVVKKEGDTLVVHTPENKGENKPSRKVEVPAAKVTEVIILGDSTLTTPALAVLLEQNVEITFLSAYGHFRGRLVPHETKNSLLRLAQVRAYDSPTLRFSMARQFVAGKVHNMRTLLLRADRRIDDPQITAAAATLKDILNSIEALTPDTEPPPDPAHPQKDSAWGSLQGLEGAASAEYFEAFGRMLRGDPGLQFNTRTRRPPRDPVNAMLSFGYSLLQHQCAGALQIAHLDPYIGFLHSAQYGKPALALDLMEEFRAPIVDSVVLTLINNRIIQADDFIEEVGAYRLKDKARRIFLEKYEERLSAEIAHPKFKYSASYRKCIELQARLAAKTLDGEIKTYPPFKIR